MKVIRSGHVCPRCGAREVERVPRKGIVLRLVTSLARRRRYRCLECLHYFYDSRIAA